MPVGLSLLLPFWPLLFFFAFAILLLASLARFFVVLLLSP